MGATAAVRGVVGASIRQHLPLGLKTLLRLPQGPRTVAGDSLLRLQLPFQGVEMTVTVSGQLLRHRRHKTPFTGDPLTLLPVMGMAAIGRRTPPREGRTSLRTRRKAAVGHS